MLQAGLLVRRTHRRFLLTVKGRRPSAGPMRERCPRIDALRRRVSMITVKRIQECVKGHYTDTSGFTDHVFGLTHLLGFRFAPRIRDLGETKLYIPKGMGSP
ncbi:hypothetical protein FCN77_12685 [Arthrobacter sp. 24S4-2]|nr:hypothetical protein FCN77_12685 [Arthrobacter sp. 24S4-2]